MYCQRLTYFFIVMVLHEIPGMLFFVALCYSMRKSWYYSKIFDLVALALAETWINIFELEDANYFLFYLIGLWALAFAVFFLPFRGK